jgi:hypothetical protein
VCARTSSPTMIGQYSNMTKPHPVNMVWYVPQAKNIPPREHIYFSIRVRVSRLIHRLSFTFFVVDGSPISVGLTPLVARPRHPTISNTPSRVRHTCSVRRMPRLIDIYNSNRTIEPVCAPEIPVASYQVCQLLEVTLAVSRRLTFSHARIASMHVPHFLFISDR